MPVEVRTSRKFGEHDDAVGAYGVGTLEIQAPDGPSWRLILATGDPETAVLEIVGESSTGTLGLRWDELPSLPRLSLGDTNGTEAAPRRCEPIFGGRSGG